jgi:hypothetical protein
MNVYQKSLIFPEWEVFLNRLNKSLEFHKQIPVPYSRHLHWNFRSTRKQKLNNATEILGKFWNLFTKYLYFLLFLCGF